MSGSAEAELIPHPPPPRPEEDHPEEGSSAWGPTSCGVAPARSSGSGDRRRGSRELGGRPGCKGARGPGTLVPRWKSSTEREPMKGNCMCVCVSMPPGRTSLPAASRTRSPAGASPGGSTWRPTARTTPSSTSTSASCEESSLTTHPPRIRRRDRAAMARGALLLGDWGQPQGPASRFINSAAGRGGPGRRGVSISNHANPGPGLRPKDGVATKSQCNSHSGL